MSKVSILVLLTFIIGCETKNVTVEETHAKINGRTLSVYVIDECEYIGDVRAERTDIITHKGNCKFCAVRSKE
jgi:hypothetical protein